MPTTPRPYLDDEAEEVALEVEALEEDVARSAEVYAEMDEEEDVELVMAIAASLVARAPVPGLAVSSSSAASSSSSAKLDAVAPAADHLVAGGVHVPPGWVMDTAPGVNEFDGWYILREPMAHGLDDKLHVRFEEEGAAAKVEAVVPAPQQAPAQTYQYGLRKGGASRVPGYFASLASPPELADMPPPRSGTPFPHSPQSQL